MQPPRLGIAAAAATALALSGCAHAPAAAEPPATAVVTGSRLPQRVDPVTGKVTPTAAVRTYVRADLDRTGRVDLDAQLSSAVAAQP